MSDPINHIIRKLTLTGEIITLSGKAGETGSLDGMGVNARFNTPMGIAVDHANNIYVADNGSQTIRKILPSGLVVTIAGAPGELGSDDGNSSVARFYSPIGIAIDSRDNLFILDDHDKSVRKISTDGFVSTFVGATGYPSHMSNPRGIAIDQLNNIYITDQSTIMKISPDGNDATIAGSYNQKGYTDGSGASAGFNFLEGIAVDSSNNLYVTDSGNNMIKLINPEGQVTTIAGLPGISNHRDGPATNALFWVPTGITVDSSGNVFVTEGYPTIRKITPLK